MQETASESSLLDTMGSGVIAFAFGVAATVIIPWITVLITRKLDSETQARATRAAAAAELLASTTSAEANAVIGRIVLLSKAKNLAEAADDLTMLCMHDSIGEHSIELGIFLSKWVPKGRFDTLILSDRSKATSR